MSENSIFNTKWNDASEGDASYTRLSVSALVSAILGVAAFLVYISPWFFFLGIIAIALSLAALWTIRRSEGILMGTQLAYIGLCSAIVALVSIAVFWPVYQHGVRTEAKQFFQLWFDAVQDGDLFRANELRILYLYRSHEPPDEQEAEEPASVAPSVPSEEDEFFDREAAELLDILTEHAHRATIAYHKTLSIHTTRASDTVNMVYAITFAGESGELETVYASIVGRRMYPLDMPDFTAAGWRLESSPRTYRMP
ncbi:MAG: DUF4190 domain-containing protein [Planctomycetaceae bacterium]|nr:DUF4190 domain-containing protein [Planctomycetaceae bacterium]